MAQLCQERGSGEILEYMPDLSRFKNTATAYSTTLSYMPSSTMHSSIYVDIESYEKREDNTAGADNDVVK